MCGRHRFAELASQPGPGGLGMPVREGGLRGESSSQGEFSFLIQVDVDVEEGKQTCPVSTNKPGFGSSFPVVSLLSQTAKQWQVLAEDASPGNGRQPETEIPSGRQAASRSSDPVTSEPRR